MTGQTKKPYFDRWKDSNEMVPMKRFQLKVPMKKIIGAVLVKNGKINLFCKISAFSLR